MTGVDAWDPARTAFLAMDCQNDICHERGAYTGPIAAQIRDSRLWSAIGGCVEAAREARVLVVHVRHITDPAIPSADHETSRVLRGIRRSGALHPGTWGAEVVAEIVPSADDLVVDKHRVSAFAGTDLDRALRQRGIDSLVLSGVTTSFVVEGTARDAVDRGFKVAVVRDGCVSLDQNTHRISMESVLPMLTTVTDSAAVTGWLSAGPRPATTLR